MKIALAIHGGAGVLKSVIENEKHCTVYQNALVQILSTGYEMLKENVSSMEAVTYCVKELEDNELFNAGKGAVLDEFGHASLDASIMEGKNKMAGAVCDLRQVKNPILAAAKVLEKSPHVFIGGEGAHRFAKNHGLELVPPYYFVTEHRLEQWQTARRQGKVKLDHDSDKMGTVGAVALDSNGVITAGTSTGGMTNKAEGRISDSCLIGAGNYASSRVGISCTGKGEDFIRLSLAAKFSFLVEFSETDPVRASQIVLNELEGIKGRGGLIAIDSEGKIVMPFNTHGMLRACFNHTGEGFVGIGKTLSRISKHK